MEVVEKASFYPPGLAHQPLTHVMTDAPAQLPGAKAVQGVHGVGNFPVNVGANPGVHRGAPQQPGELPLTPRVVRRANHPQRRQGPAALRQRVFFRLCRRHGRRGGPDDHRRTRTPGPDGLRFFRQRSPPRTGGQAQRQRRQPGKPHVHALSLRQS
ncbi:hypothetical protein [Yokenella regensburgei]|uniref:hypothetical protein n=1 Tax=Yokenella regensburgei TaxID=158877 RepID=UPI003ED94972